MNDDIEFNVEEILYTPGTLTALLARCLPSLERDANREATMNLRTLAFGGKPEHCSTRLQELLNEVKEALK